MVVRNTLLSLQTYNDPMRFFLHFALLCSFIASSAQTNNLQSLLNQAREAQRAGDNPKFYELILAAHKVHPYHQGILFNTARAAALNNKPEEAIAFLTKAIYIKADFDLKNPDLKSLEGRDDFEKLKSIQTQILKPIINSDTAFVVHDRTSHIESITPGERKNVFYLGSIHKRKIIRVDEKGNAEDFTTSRQDGLCSVFGLKVDPTKKYLWACSSPMEEMENYDTAATSGVYKFDIKTGKLLKRYESNEKQGFIFGDLTLDPKGNVFVSDTKNNIIFIVNEKSGKLESYFTSPDFWNLQGISFTADGRYLFIADYIKGIFRLDTKDKSLQQLTANFDESLKSVDGLTFYKNSLIAIQNAIIPMRVTQYQLNEKLDGITDYTIIDRGHPAFNEPTIGCIADDTLYYIGNSLWSGYDDKHQLKKSEELQEVVVLKSSLKK
jgi:DNA-binding beta-propeller fold protein YncE